jgi:hypothetical protein
MTTTGHSPLDRLLALPSDDYWRLFVCDRSRYAPMFASHEWEELQRIGDLHRDLALELNRMSDTQIMRSWGDMMCSASLFLAQITAKTCVVTGRGRAA